VMLPWAYPVQNWDQLSSSASPIHPGDCAATALEVRAQAPSKLPDSVAHGTWCLRNGLQANSTRPTPKAPAMPQLRLDWGVVNPTPWRVSSCQYFHAGVIRVPRPPRSGCSPIRTGTEAGRRLIVSTLG
jgi:hypothetical protein